MFCSYILFNSVYFHFAGKVRVSLLEYNSVVKYNDCIHKFNKKYYLLCQVRMYRENVPTAQYNNIP